MKESGHDLLYCPDPDMLGEPRTESGSRAGKFRAPF